MDYSLNQLALITGYTTRTLRNHLKQGNLNGEKIDGNWRFTEEDIDAFLRQPAIKQELSSKQNAVVYDFLSDTYKKTNRICTILDFPVSSEEAKSINEFFAGEINRMGQDIRFYSTYDRNMLRVILSGSEDQVMDIQNAYYRK
ncbi:MAG: helix-turn-helix domain-containing protein [Clostridia bacterium]|nr:helix-turn-helix domain-containing protein [Clostridia bacterium]